MTTMNLRFAFEKETKGAVRFQEVGQDGKPAFAPSIGTLYIRKSALPASGARRSSIPLARSRPGWAQPIS
jgi:hypothetical protein